MTSLRYAMQTSLCAMLLVAALSGAGTPRFPLIRFTGQLTLAATTVDPAVR